MERIDKALINLHSIEKAIHYISKIESKIDQLDKFILLSIW